MKKPFAQEGPERAAISARASAFRAFLPEGTAHSKGEGAGERGHGLYIVIHRRFVNAGVNGARQRVGLSEMVPTALRSSSARVPAIST
jgi:hypothetical protein